MRPTRLAAFVCLSAALCTGCENSRQVSTVGDTEPAAHEDLDATLWMQTSAEYRAITQMVYRNALEKVEQARQDSKWSAIPTQQTLLDAQPTDAPALPPAVILDVDETVLDNSGFQSQLIDADSEFSKEDWQRFVALADSKAILGAKMFVDVCRESGVTVFFVTNRDVSVEKHTRRNMEQQRLIDPGAPDRILSKYERDEWSTDKESRRAFIASRYRVLAILGDDLNDFVWVGVKPSAESRRKLAEKHANLWGNKWFMFPNANYGGWERSIYAFEDTMPRDQKVRLKRKALQRPPPAAEDVPEEAKPTAATMTAELGERGA